MRQTLFTADERLQATNDLYTSVGIIVKEVLDQNAGTDVSTTIYPRVECHISPMILLRPEATETRLRSFNKFDQTMHCLCKGAFPLALAGYKMLVGSIKYNIVSNETTIQTRLRIEQVFPN